MLSASFRTELTWFVSASAVALGIGLIIGWPVLALTFALAAYTLWLLYRLERVVQWLRSGGKPRRAPHSNGLSDEIIQLIHREKKYSRKQRHKLKESLFQFNTLAANLPDAIIVLDKENQIKWSNSAARSLLAIDPERDIGQRIDNLLRTPAFADFLLDSSDRPEAEIECPTSPDKTLAIRRVRNGRRMSVLIAADITQRVKVRRMRKDFVADVSHELRTPLTVIGGYLELLLEHDEFAPEVYDALNQVSLQSDRMRGIVGDLLELSKIESNPLEEHEGESVNISKLINAMLVPLKKDARQHKFLLHLDDTISVSGSERELYSACNNLLTNAVKYTDPGTTVSVSWTLCDDGSARYCVSDDGPGIEPRHLSRLSERFYRVDTGRSRDQGGTGLGLAIVKHAVQRHGGTLEINSTPGSGSQFVALFPSSRVMVSRETAVL